MLDFYENVIPDQMHDKLTESVVAMMATGNLPYYGEFALFINFYEAKNNPYIPTAGVNVTSAGMNFYWNRDFIDKLPQPEVNFLLIHEEFHILFDHVKRSVGYDLRSANIVQDMIINQIIYDEIMKKQGLGTGVNSFMGVPKDEFGNNSALFIPKEYKGEAIFENLYEWYVNKKREWQEKNKDKVQKMKNEANKCPKCGSSQEQGAGDGKEEKEDAQGGKGKKGEKGGKEKGEQDGDGGQGGEKSDQKGKGGKGEQGDQDGDGDGDGGSGDGTSKCPSCGHEHNNNESRKGQKDTSGNDKYGEYGKNGADMYSMDTIFEGEEREEQNTLDAHLPDDIPQELKNEIVEGIMTKLKNRGLESGEIDTILQKLRKTKKDYLKEIKRTMSNHVFGSKKQKTIVRPNRRGISGLKGHKKYSNEINVLLDTSGSMGGDFEKVLSYIFQNDIRINLIQCDTRIQQVYHIKDKRELEKMKISGLGGTTLQPGIDFVNDKKNKINKFNSVILTDGWTDSLDFKNTFTKTLILSTAGKCPITYDNGKVKQIENIGQED